VQKGEQNGGTIPKKAKRGKKKGRDHNRSGTLGGKKNTVKGGAKNKTNERYLKRATSKEETMKNTVCWDREAEKRRGETPTEEEKKPSRQKNLENFGEKNKRKGGKPFTLNDTTKGGARKNGSLLGNRKCAVKGNEKKKKNGGLKQGTVTEKKQIQSSKRDFTCGGGGGETPPWRRSGTRGRSKSAGGVGKNFG